jgi:hypothetical protein
MLTVVGVDPGGVTGWCVARLDPDQAVAAGQPDSVLAALTGMWVGQIGGPEVDHVDAVLAAVYGPVSRLLHDWHADTVFDDEAEGDAEWVADVVVVESFNLRVSLSRGAASKRETLSPVRISFGIEYGLHSRGYEGVLITQGSGASDAKAVVTDDRLRDWGLYVGAKERKRHQRDAQRHALLAAKKTLAAYVSSKRER